MSIYTTGELAKLCGVSVRTVQFYDTKNILKPSELSEGGRRLYSDADLEKLKLICVLKGLGLSLDTIKGILESDAPEKVLLTFLDEQEKQLAEEIKHKQKQKEAVALIRESVRSRNAILVNSINDIELIMNGKKKLRKTRAVMLITGIIIDLVEIAAILLWIIKGMWLPFVICLPLIVIAIALIVRMYYKNVMYICPECGNTFKPRGGEFFFSKHTFKTRKLTCTSCGHKGYCVETGSLK